MNGLDSIDDEVAAAVQRQTLFVQDRLRPLGEAFLAACREEHRAKTLGNPEAMAVAHFARLRAAAAIDTAQDGIADDHLSGLALAIDRRPGELRDLLLPLLAMLLAPLWRDMTALATAVAGLERGRAAV